MNQKDTILCQRKKIAFFDYPDVFEDFYPHYDVTQEAFATEWHNTGNHAMVKMVQEYVGEVTWYMLSVRPNFFNSVRHAYVGCTVKYVRSSLLHRFIWRMFYYNASNRFKQQYYRVYATLASYLAIMSWPLLRKLWKDRPDAIFCQEYCSGRFDVLHLIAWILRIPILTMHAGSTGNYMGNFLRKYTLPMTDWVYPSGKREEQFLVKHYRVPECKMSILRPPSDITMYSPMDKRQAASLVNIPADGFHFLFLGRLEDNIKRVSSIITAFQSLARQCPDAYLLIAGNGKDENALRRLASEEYSDRIHFLGWVVDDQKKKTLLSAADCLVLASRREGFPTVIGEAMACGTPVLATDVGTISDLVINDETGWLIPPLDDESLLQKMLWVATHAKQVRQLRSSIRTFAVEHISYTSVSRQLVMGFEQTLNKKGA